MRRLIRTIALGIVVAVGGLYAVVKLTAANRPAASSGPGPGPTYAVGSPGLGQPAPLFTLPSSAGGRFDLQAATQTGPVLLYFQEGLTCQPCWDQIKALESEAPKFHELGIDRIVSITTDPLGDVTQKARDEALTTPVLADTDLAVSRAYNANQYGMMGSSRDGHSFVLVDRAGVIRWRADYGGPPDYTMYVAPADLLGQLARAVGTAG